MNRQTILLISDMRQVYLAEIMTKRGLNVRCLDIRNSGTVKEQIEKLKSFLAEADMLILPIPVTKIPEQKMLNDILNKNLTNDTLVLGGCFSPEQQELLERRDIHYLDFMKDEIVTEENAVAALVVFAAKKAQSNAESANMDAKRAAYDGVQEYLDTIQELKSCSREEEYLEGLEKKLDYVVKCSFRNEIAPGAATTTAQFILRFGLVAVMLVGGILVTTGSLSIPMFILFLLFAGRIYDPFTSCFMLMAEVFSALVSVKRMKQIDATPEQTGTNVCNNKGYDIEFKNVVFSYNEEPVLKGVSFVAKQGEVTALVGPSGSGKSTASKLAARFWDADSGTITLGGVDVKTVEPETLFKNYAIVFQDVMLFDETVMENIRLGRGDATDEEVMAAARAAQCEEFIQRLPQGYQTNIGENGSALSGGERQRISIARALLKNAPIVLLDEATASMDAESETLIQDALSVLLKDKTVMVIAHRMRTVANADKIVVLDDGKVSEMGTPAELMKKGGLYAHLVELQQGK